MAYFVGPDGAIFEADESEAKDLAAQGLRPASADDITRHNENVAFNEKGIVGRAGDVAVGGLQAIARGSMAPGMAIESAITGKPAISPRHPDSAFTESVFGVEAQARKGRHPLTAGVGEAAPAMVAGGALGGLAAAGSLGLPAAGGLVAAESGLQGVSQEAIDSVTERRAYSASAALANGVTDLALSALTFGLAHGGGKLLRRGAGEAAETAAPGVAPSPEPPPMRRNWLGEVDPGPLPEPAGTPRRARSAGAAGAANSPYRADGPGAPRTRAAGAADEVADAANDVEPFADDLYDAAAKSIDDANAGKGLDSEARFLADPKTAESLTNLGAANVADQLDNVRRVIRDDASLAAKNSDFQRLAAEWTPEQVAAKREWVEGSLAKEADDLLRHIDETRAAAADVRSGKAGPRAGGAEAYDAGGFDSSLQKTLRTGLDRIRRSDGADQVIAIDSLKREVGGLVRDIGRSRTLDDATKTERMGRLRSLYETMQFGLEDEGMFGRMGALQRDTNAAVTRLIEPFQRIEAKFSERLQDTWGKTGQAAINRETKASAVASMLRQGPTEQREFIRVLDDGLSAADELIDARLRHGVTDVADLQAAKRGLGEIRDEFKFGRVLQIAGRRAGEAAPGIGQAAAEAGVDFLANKIPIVGGFAGREGKRLLKTLANAPDLPKPGTPLGDALGARLKAYARNPDLADAGTSRTLPRWLQEQLRGKGGQVAAVGGVVGAGALLAPGQASAAEGEPLLPAQRDARTAFEQKLAGMPPERQAAVVRQAEAFARLQQRTETRVKAAVEDLFRTGKDPSAPPRSRTARGREIDRRSAELDVPRATARFMGKRTDDPVEAWAEKSQLVTRAVQDPLALARTMAENLGDLPETEPEVFSQMVAQTMGVLSYLHDTMPTANGKSALDPEGFPPTELEINEWAGRWVGALHPLDTLDDLAANDILPEQMEAVRLHWPGEYQRFQAAAYGHIHDLAQSGRIIPLQALEQIDRALELDGAGEPTLSQAFVDILNQARAQASQQQPPQPKPPGPTQSQLPARMASSALGSLHGEAGA